MENSRSFRQPILDVMDKKIQKRMDGSIDSLVQSLCSHCAAYKNTGRQT
jgi:hypothetical protein